MPETADSAGKRDSALTDTQSPKAASSPLEEPRGEGGFAFAAKENHEAEIQIDFSAYVSPVLQQSGQQAEDVDIHDPESEKQLYLIVDGAYCGACIHKIETALKRQADVTHARLNLTTRRLVVQWTGAVEKAVNLVHVVEALGYRLVPFDPEYLISEDRKREKELLRAMAVAGFAAGNVMVMSIPVWAGHFQNMGPFTRGLMHWYSALIALPTVLYAGMPFYRSALRALRARQMNMDVPIALAVILAAAMSLHETIQGGLHVYFDSAVSLLFFLLVGRYLDSRARGQARSVAERLLALESQAVLIQDQDGRQRLLPPKQIEPGMMALVASGERVGVDGNVVAGRSDIDSSLITGETVPKPVGPGDSVFSGTLNVSAPIKIRVEAVGESTLLAEIVRLMETAEQRKARFVGIADRIARLYAPVVHILAAIAFLGWWGWGGVGWHQSLMIAVAVLIITCPCALGLAVPAVQVIAGGRLLRMGILLKSPNALERFAEIDTVVFDKTGTLTEGRPVLQDRSLYPEEDLYLAASLAANSHHPLAKALCQAVPDGKAVDTVIEEPGLGLRWQSPDGEVRLGSRRFCLVSEGESGQQDRGPEMFLAKPGQTPLRFHFADRPRDDAQKIVQALQKKGLHVVLLSGDRKVTVADVAQHLKIEHWHAECTPKEKCDHLETLAAEGRKVLMVGDGLNDAPALASAYVSLSPSTAVDISQTTADAVFQGRLLKPVLEILTVAKTAERLVTQNFILAFGYNVMTVPLALSGFVTPLIAAIAMSASSVVVTGNALRLAWFRKGSKVNP